MGKKIIKVILRQEVENLGKKGEIVEIKPGYARNFLIPQGLASLSTPDLEEKARAETSQKEKEKEKRIKDLEKMANLLRGKTFEIEAKAGQGKKLFGSVSFAQIKQKIAKKLKISFEKGVSSRPKVIKNLGKHQLKINLGSGISTQINIEVKAKK